MELNLKSSIPIIFCVSMITNFHMPKSTLLMMSSAFLGNDFIKKAYEEAMKEKYNFLGYGDSMLII